MESRRGGDACGNVIAPAFLKGAILAACMGM